MYIGSQEIVLEPISLALREQDSEEWLVRAEKNVAKTQFGFLGYWGVRKGQCGGTREV